MAVRHGFDLEPLLPDPAPAWIDPEETFHPALTEPISALPLHRFPTPGARAALAARLVSEPGHPDLSNPEDPWTNLYRFAAREAMEPEVTGVMALVLLRERLAEVRRTWRPRLPDPEAALHDPNLDVFAHRRARLIDADWQVLWEEIQAAVRFLGDDDALAFERSALRASAAWLEDYRAWWSIAAELGPSESLEDADHGRIRALLDEFGPDLRSAIAAGTEAEAEFMELVGSKPTGPVNARWLLAEQLRALRDLRSADRARSLRLHDLLRRTDRARVRVQLAYRASLLRLWLASAEEVPAFEQEILDVPDPAHPTTLGAGLGRVVGMVLLRRLRRADDTDATALAERALQLAPEELAVRLTWNDLRYARGPRDRALLTSLKEETQRWDSISARTMGVATAEALGDRGAARHLEAGLFDRALATGTGSGWAVAVSLTLRNPTARADRARLEALAAAQQPPPNPPDPLAFVLLGDDVVEAWGDLELALAQAADDLDQSAGLHSAPLQPTSAKKKATPRWRQLVAKKLVAHDHPEFAGRLFARIQSLRAAAPALRSPRIAPQLRLLTRQLAEAAELGVELPEELETVVGLLGGWLDQPSEVAESDLADRLGAICYPLMHALRRPRLDRIVHDLAQTKAHLRVLSQPEALALADQLRARLGDPSADLDHAAADLAALAASIGSPQTPDSPEPPPAPGTMRYHEDFDRFSVHELGMLPEALLRARQLVRLFNLAGGRRDKKRLRSGGGTFYELRHRTAQHGGIRVFYRRDGDGWIAVAAMSKYDDRQQREAIDRVVSRFAEE